MTGSTSTSLWTVYNKGIRNYCGNDLVEGSESMFEPASFDEIVSCVKFNHSSWIIFLRDWWLIMVYIFRNEEE